MHVGHKAHKVVTLRFTELGWRAFFLHHIKSATMLSRGSILAAFWKWIFRLWFPLIFRSCIPSWLNFPTNFITTLNHGTWKFPSSRKFIAIDACLSDTFLSAWGFLFSLKAINLAWHSRDIRKLKENDEDVIKGRDGSSEHDGQTNWSTVPTN